MKKIIYKGIDEVVYYEKLTNGMDVYMYPKSNAKNFYLTINTKFGSMDTEFKVGKNKKYTVVPNGTAHFLEHQMFQEGDNQTAFSEFSKLGSSVNAFTTYNQTCYEVVASNHFRENLEELLNYVQNPYFKQRSVDQERGIIKEEIKMYDNTPMAVLNFGLEYNLNIVDKHKYLISGTEEDIKNITPEDLTNCYEVFYNPNNMFMVLTGKFNPHEALGIIKENQANKVFSEAQKITKKRRHEPLDVANPYEDVEMDVGIPKVKIAYKLDKREFKGYSESLLKIYLDWILQAKFGPSSDLNDTLRSENLIIEDIATYREVRDDYILITFDIETEYKTEVIDMIRKELKNIKLSKEEVNRMMKVSIANFMTSFNDIIAVAENIEDDILTNNKIQEDIIETYKKIDTTTINNVASLINIEHECIFYIKKLSV